MKSKKLFAVLAVVVIAAMISGVAAWLSDDDTQTDEIVTGDVSIALMETNWRPENASDLHPQDILPKNPTVTNTGTSSAFVFLEVDMSTVQAGAQIADSRALMALAAPTPLYTTRCGTGEYDTANWQRLIGPIYDKAKNQVSWIYSYSRGNVMTELKPGSTTSALFDAIQLINVQRYRDVSGLNANIYVRAYAIQTEQLGQSGSAKSSDVVWSILRNACKIELASETLPQATPKVLKLLPTPAPVVTPKPAKASKRSGQAAATPTVTPDIYEDEGLRRLFGAQQPEPVG